MTMRQCWFELPGRNNMMKPITVTGCPCYVRLG